MANTNGNQKRRKPAGLRDSVGPAVVSIYNNGKQLGNSLKIEGPSFKEGDYVTIKAYPGSRVREEER